MPNPITKIRLSFGAMLVSASLMCGMSSTAQVLKGSISGTVIDPQAALVSGAQVKAIQKDTGAILNSTSDTSGFFRFSLIPVGLYDVQATAAGFKTSVRTDVTVTAAVDNGIGSIQLTIGESSATVEVTARDTLIESTQSQVTASFSGETLHTFAGIQESLGLDVLALFVPGVTNTRDNTFSNINGTGISMDGLRGRSYDQQIDGQNNNDNTAGGLALFLFAPNFLDQYVVVSNQFSPEYGRNSGLVVNLITKSGSNNWHGEIFENENNSALNTLTNFEKRFQAVPSAPRFNEQYGGFTIGGPIVKNKVFMFGGFTERNISSNSIFTSRGITPAPAGLDLLNSCFPNSTSLQVFDKFGPYAISFGNPQPVGNARLIPVRSGAVTCSAVPFAPVERTLPLPLHGFNWIVKSDALLSKDSLTSRYLFDRTSFFTSDSGGAANGYPFTSKHVSQAILESWTHSFSSYTVNEARISFNRLNAEFGGNELGNTVPTSANLRHALAQVTIQTPGFDDLFGAATSIPGNSLPAGRVVNTWQGQDNWNHLLHRHQLKAGVNFTYQRSLNNSLPNINGSLQFANWGDVNVPNTPGCPSANPAFCVQGFVSNVPNQVRIANPSSSRNRSKYG